MGQVLEGFGAEGSNGDAVDGVGGVLGDDRHAADAILTAKLDRGLVAVAGSSSSGSGGGGGDNSSDSESSCGDGRGSNKDSKGRRFLTIGQGQGNAAEPHNTTSDLLMHSLELERSRSDVYHLAQLKRKGGGGKTNAREAAEAAKAKNTQRAVGEGSASDGNSPRNTNTTVNHDDGNDGGQQAVFSRSTSWEYESRITHSDAQSYSLFDFAAEPGDAFVGGVSPLLATGEASSSPVSTDAGTGGRPLSEFVRVVGGSGLSGVWSEGSEATRRPSSAERCLQRRLRMAEQRLEQHRRQSLAQLRQYEQAISQILCPLVLSPRSVEDIKAVTVCKQKHTHRGLLARLFSLLDLSGFVYPVSDCVFLGATRMTLNSCPL
eukprot:m.126062 g.126062  ORF g.126062 m.126062 type:complete len:376 (-) comp16672_c0_seq1:1023-2150(-)